MTSDWPRSQGAQRFRPFLQPLIGLGIIPTKISGCHQPFAPLVVCFVMLSATLYSALSTFFCDHDPIAARNDPTKQGFLGVLSTARRNIQLFCCGFTICWFCWKAREVPRLIVQSGELLENDGLSRKCFPPLAIYFLILLVAYGRLVPPNKFSFFIGDSTYPTTEYRFEKNNSQPYWASCATFGLYSYELVRYNSVHRIREYF